MSMCDALCSTPYNSTNSGKFHRSTIKGVVIAIDYVESTHRLDQGNLCHQPQDSDEPLKSGIMVSTNNWAWPTGMQLYTATNTSKTAEHPSVLDSKKNWRVGTVDTHKAGLRTYWAPGLKFHLGPFNKICFSKPWIVGPFLLWYFRGPRLDPPLIRPWVHMVI
jgi:hypothetical protein